MGDDTPDRRNGDIRIARLEEQMHNVQQRTAELREGQIETFKTLREMQVTLSRIESNSSQRCADHIDHESRIRRHSEKLSVMEGQAKGAAKIAGVVSTLIGLAFGAIGIWIRGHK